MPNRSTRVPSRWSGPAQPLDGRSKSIHRISLVYMALARAEYFSRDSSAFRAAADRAMALNPLDTDALAFIGTVTAYSGDWAAGVALNERAMALNPHHPGTYRIASLMDHYRRRDYAQALAILDRVNMPSYPYLVMARAAIYAQLGRTEAAYAVLRDAERRMPEFVANFEGELHKWFTPDVVEHFHEGIEKARAGARLEARTAPASAVREESLERTDPDSTN